MTDLQVRAQQNLLKEEELENERWKLALEKRKIEETERANRMQESLKEASDRAQYGITSYISPEHWEDYKGAEEDPLVTWNVGKDILELIQSVFMPLGNLKTNKSR